MQPTSFKRAGIFDLNFACGTVEYLDATGMRRAGLATRATDTSAVLVTIIQTQHENTPGWPA